MGNEEVKNLRPRAPVLVLQYLLPVRKLIKKLDLWLTNLLWVYILLWETFLGNEEVKRGIDQAHKPVIGIVKASTVHAKRLQDVA